MAEEKVKQDKSTTNESAFYYFYTTGCGFCKKVDPIVDELIADGYEILKLDLADGENNKLQAEIKKEYNIQCGTPLFVDAESGNTVCGFREKELLEKLLRTEHLSTPERESLPKKKANTKIMVDIIIHQNLSSAENGSQ